MKILFVIAVIGSLVGLNEGEKILGIEVVKFSDAKAIIQYMFPTDYITALQYAVSGTKFCFPFCESANNQVQVAPIRAMSMQMYPQAGIESTDEVVQIVKKVITEDMIKTYIGGSYDPTLQEAFAKAVYFEFQVMPEQTKGLEWAATFTKIAKDELDSGGKDEHIKSFLEFISNEFEISSNIKNEQWRESRMEFIEDLLQKGTKENFQSFVLELMKLLDEATSGFNECPASHEFSQMFSFAMKLAHNTINTGTASQFFWQVITDLLDDFRSLCTAAESADAQENAPVVDMSFGGSSSSSSRMASLLQRIGKK
uniref:28S ribosomal protein S9, mitochondrial n=1 Tax=Phallusia mammillata TaxID=59560 RepID=A0A6F9DKP5_9ASCI|nr:28S ribosomal protein S9, mitochondrial [Phallusia mammillata]